jgi:hypothetical protein
VTHNRWPNPREVAGNGPKFPFVSTINCCGAARRTGHSPRPRNLMDSGSQTADKTATDGSSPSRQLDFRGQVGDDPRCLVHYFANDFGRWLDASHHARCLPGPHCEGFNVT